MKKIMLNAAMLASVLFFATSCNDKRSSKNEDSEEVAKDENKEKFAGTDVKDDTKFAVKAADGGLLEVKLGELAQQKGVSSEVKDLGKMMVQDHTKANEELKAIAQQKSISLPATLSDDCQKKYDDIAAKTGKDFDDAFTDYMVKDHKDDLDAFNDEAKKGSDPDLQSWAAGKISTLEHHLAMSQTAEKAVDEARKSTGKLD